MNEIETKLPEIDTELHVSPIDIVDGVEVIDVCDIEAGANNYEGREMWGADRLSWDDVAKYVGIFVEVYDCAYYSAEKHEFLIYSAVRKAKAEGKTRVIVENMS